ncbi:glycosyltransferase family 2 protein [Pseudomonas pergaminensis]|uniref:Glycosyltransferase family 2 protein n=1 Tax=Pseudomonas pergaminensis TaxID=2853159 RepID=A0ABD7TP34_9PSED|nr:MULTISPECIES: glycosyltransferase family 2 protein [Pseudomonas]MBT1262064.1 glycosyltransferase family 2 protein [Pseudomonas sp. VS40]MBT1273979.1 glycosyltransferase family 2 protein [Pseudomonas sp. VS59]USW03336.1 glycosyltransferase family 2 protein [Pseudomonas pergaminensis]
MKRETITVIILTYNESLHIARAIDSVRAFSDEVLVVDSFSTDSTCDIARAHGAWVVQHPFVNQAKQFQWALDNLPITGNWTLRLDADEIIEADLAAEINARLPTLASDITGINFKRKHIFMGRWVRHGGRYPLRMLRLWRTGFGRMEDRWMDEHISVAEGRTITLEGGFADHNLHDLTFFTHKHNQYATREAIEVLNTRLGLFAIRDELHTGQSSFQAKAKRLIKNRLYNRVPFTLSSTAYFLWRYIIQLGFLDGRSGLVYHLLQGYWYRFLVGAKVLELETAIAHLNDKEAIVRELSKLTGHNLNLPKQK